MSRNKPYTTNQESWDTILKKKLRIPMNQREYSWEEKEITKFLDDIFKIYEEGKYVEKMGSIINLNYKGGNYNNYRRGRYNNYGGGGNYDGYYYGWNNYPYGYYYDWNNYPLIYNNYVPIYVNENNEFVYANENNELGYADENNELDDTEIISSESYENFKNDVDNIDNNQNNVYLIILAIIILLLIITRSK